MVFIKTSTPQIRQPPWQKATQEPERTTLKIDMLAEARDKKQKQGINGAFPRDKEVKQGKNTDIESTSRDKIIQIEGISEKTRDKLRLMTKYMNEHRVVKNHEIAELLGVGDDRARVLLMLLVDYGILIAKGDKKERTYTLKAE